MKKLYIIFSFVIVAALMIACNKENVDSTSPSDGNSKYGKLGENQMWEGPLPPATVKLLSPKVRKPGILELGNPASLEPAEFSATLMAGETVCEEKKLHLPANTSPAMGDVLFCIDLTGSMGGALNNVKVNANNIMTAVQGIIPDTWFGVITHKDYPSTYSSSCYSNTYGGGTDFPYALNQSITSNPIAVQGAINPLGVGGGADGPESYTRAIYEASADPLVGWRGGSKRFLVMFLDNIPHDCSLGTGIDPGRNGVIDNGPDDLDMAGVLAGLSANNITPIILYNGFSDYALWDSYASSIGGTAHQVNSDGTIPGGVDIATFIASQIEEQITHLNEVKLEACDPAYSSWISSISPSSYTDITLGTDQDLDFQVCFTVPAGTPDGEYCFNVCAVADGAILARQRVCLTVRNEIQVSIDIKPTSCPNPLNVKDNGQIPVAICGTSSFDVSKIDPSTVKFVGVSLTRYSLEDVATPFARSADGCYDCTTAGGDGTRDFNAKFDAPSVVGAVGTHNDRDCLLLEVTGKLKAEYGGTPFRGSDIMRYQKK